MSTQFARLLAVTGLLTALALGAARAADATIRIRDASGYAGGTTAVGVNFSSTEEAAGISFRVNFDAAKLKFITVTAGSAATAANKEVAYGLPESGVVSIVVYGLNNNVIPDGRIADLYFVIKGTPSAGTVYPLVGSEPASTEADGAEPIDTSIVDGSITVSECITPSAPSNVSASDGTMPDRVRVTWNPANGATSYRVYRSTTNSFTNAQFLGETTSTKYDDFGASPAALASSGGCGGSSTLQFTSHYYWVVTQSPCATSTAGGPDTGYRGGAKNVSQVETYETVLPSPASEGIDVDDALAIRVRSEEALAEIWGRVETSGLEDENVVWMLAAGGAANDGWVVYEPVSPWLPDEVILMAVGGTTVSGAAVGPFTYAFPVTPKATLKSLRTPVPQPDDESAVGVFAEDPGRFPALPGGVGPVVSIEPGAAYSAPQRVWLPVPEGASPDSVAVFYFQGSPSTGAWHAGSGVDAWLVENSALVLETAEGVYFGFLVNHGGVAQLGQNSPAPQIAQASLGPDLRWRDGLAENLILLALVLAALSISHLHTKHRQPRVS
ncbi:MAG: hypothetical protein IT365_25340 [Candidatus Hydrogenedentes bacterium]|nr:hypothetical protein [Candidatus Hydrogenedentota bacterium]